MGAHSERIAVMCIEGNPLDCHRRLVVEYLAQHWDSVAIEHLA